MPLAQSIFILVTIVGIIFLVIRLSKSLFSRATFKNKLANSEAIIYYEHKRKAKKLILTKREIWRMNETFDLSSLEFERLPAIYSIELADHVFPGDALIYICNNSGAESLYSHNGKILSEMLTVQEAKKLCQQ